MRKLRLLSCLWLLSASVWAQIEDGAKISTASQAIQSENFTIQVGVPFLGVNNNTHTVTPVDVRYPWDVLYLFGTFAEESFDISKGYFGDKVLINWTIRNNQEDITSLTLYRRIYTVDNSEVFKPVSNISPTTTTYEDKYVEGGVLYEYKLVAEGVSDIEEKYTTYITGIGYRNPTAVVTGNISFEGGNPVKDVTIKATSEGSDINTGSALSIPTWNTLKMDNMNNPITNKATLQAWIRSKDDIEDPVMDFFRLTNFDANEFTIEVIPVKTNKWLYVFIDRIGYTIKNFFPSGTINARGEDELLSIENFNKQFVHISVVLEDGKTPLLYINGRPINEEYAAQVNANLDAEDENYSGPYMEIVVPEETSELSLNGNETVWHDASIGRRSSMIVDEVRVWNDVLDAQRIRTDYKRLISGNDARLIAYLRANENVGEYAYDLSRNGFEYNKNHGEFVQLRTVNEGVSWINGSGNIPTSDQLGVLGVSDENGNYEITGIPYSGTGESFTITPLYGQHKFEPNQQLVFLGEGSEVVNQINFTDISSFVFKGKVLYDTRNVFPSYVEADGSGIEGNTQISGPGILDEGYNYYQKGNEKFNKGEYWYNDNNTPDDDTDDYLERYARIAVEDVKVFIDGQIVLDENNTPVTSDSDGYFEISVPIGNHYITVQKDGHEFTYEGRFPAESGTFKEFFEDAVETTLFVDTTRVSLVGKVVGGAVESQKVIGFGENGIYTTKITDADGNEETLTVSAKNNIGTADITLDYKPIGGTVTKYTQFNFSTNSESGEYRVSVLPLDYEISSDQGLRIPSSTANISILEANETVNLSENVALTTPEFLYDDEVIATGTPYHFEKSFEYRSTPVLRVTSQTSADEISIDDDTTISTEGFTYPVYKQFSSYNITLSSFERYLNEDGATPIEDIVPVVDGELLITNNLALEGSEVTEVDTDDASITNYTFKAGLPSVFSPFTKTINIKYRVKGKDYEAENYNNTGIILGGLSDGSQTFVTAAPDTPDIILRDPPGSNSFASIEAGESISFTVDNDFASSIGVSENLELKLGVKFGAGGGLAGPVIESETTNNVQAGFSLNRTSRNGEDLTKTYTFTQTISTSDDPEYVGAEGDLYIGQSKNYFYGSYDDVRPSDTEPANATSLELTNTKGESLFISKQKAMYFVEEPSETFFTYTQKYILTSLIPELELILSNLQNGIISTDDEGVLTEDQYKEQIRLWKSVIRENERTKYLVKNDRSTYKSNLTTIVNDFNTEIETIITNSELTSFLENNLKSKLTASNKIKTLLETNFEDNISFDAGVGEFTRSVETSVVSGSSREINLTIDEDFAFQVGFTLNKMGLISTTSGMFNQDINASLSEEETSTTTISYTLKDNDPANLLSVDVVNLYGGNGPVFSTIGGVTSCPYEPAELSYFYNHDTYDPDADTITHIENEEDREQLSFATQKAEAPLISVEVASVSNVPESQNAEFVLKLENTSDFTSDAASFNYFELLIDNTTNPYNAEINLMQNATIVYVPYGQPVYYTLTLGKSVSDVYDYENIRVVLQSRCDPVNVYDDVLISAHFTPSCSEVAVSAPLDNWVYNIDTAYNNDGSSNPMNIDLTEFNTTFNSFQKIDLEYRLATAPTWTRLHTYYTTEDFYNAADAAGESEISLISSATLTHPWNIADAQLPNGNYEIRARSTCTNDTEFISEVISGTVDLGAPQRFGTPLPSDGILSSGEDLKVSFSEAIFYNPAISAIEIKGATNQLPIDNNVSLYFNGVNNTAEINNPRITSGDLSLEFWMNNATTASTATIIQQTQGINIRLNNGVLSFTLGGVTASGAIATDGLFHHYTFTHKNNTGEIAIYEDDREIAGATGSANLQFTNNNTLIIGGNNFVGNIHALRLWNKSLTLEEAYASRFDQLVGNENNLIGYWPMNEGRGNTAKDLARFKHAVINADWDIKPKGNSYEFTNGQYLSLDNVDFVQLTDEMDTTISFWIKTANAQNATIFSNGKGDGTDVIQSNGKANKWAINMDTNGMLSLASEGSEYTLTSSSIADNNWHHVTLLFNRIGALRTYVDANLVSSNEISTIGGFSGNKIWLGARGSKDLAGNESVDRIFTGKIDEFRLWNTLRNVEQITRDQYNEVSLESIGLVLYARMNAPEAATGNGPRYYHAYSNQTFIPSNAVMNTGVVNYNDDVPPIKGERALVKFEVSNVINDDEMIIEPLITDWASLEGQVLDITVHRMFDAANNIQESPITWTAYVKRNEVSWYADGFGDIVDIVKNDGEETTFNIVLVNKGGNGQPYNINNIPSWLSLSSTSGTLEPDSSVTITATVDANLTAGEYLENLYLETDFGYDEKLQIEVRSLANAPDWTVNPTDFDYSMNVVGKVKIDGIFSADSYDKVAAFVGDEVRGVANLVYDDAFQEYFAFVTIYSNVSSGETIEFSIWDASQGVELKASINASSNLNFIQNGVIGTLSNPAIFENTGTIAQAIELNEGWTWVSFNVEDANFNDLNAFTNGMTLETSDRILSHAPVQLEVYNEDISNATNNSWGGDITNQGGLNTLKMYKIKLAKAQALNLQGSAVNINTWNFDIKENWNWLPYPITSNETVSEALAYFNATDGDVIKSQNLFAIYDETTGWKGTLSYLEAGKGYMIKSANEQTFNYPTYLNTSAKNLGKQSRLPKQEKIADNFKKYAQNMNAIVSLPKGYNELWVYDTKGILKGFSKTQEVNNTDLSFITIYGNAPENLVFYVSNGINKLPTTFATSFKNNEVLGTIITPITLEVLDNAINVFPNPFKEELLISTNATQSETIHIHLYSLAGRALLSKQVKVNSGQNIHKIIPSNLATGTYVLQIEMAGNVVTKKVVKTN
ncbi:putative secreted protein (Por secretion system target) [Tenacibaculum sp. 190524A02b]|uniref:Secreted protein (Por secretion system target) n=1 Tax=Tenacibaculum vairaonense TaxID=3137860 RepID=A0ABM9PH54_9FLAO